MAEPNQLPPVNDTTDSGVRTKSDPPPVKAVRAWGDAAENIVGMLLFSYGYFFTVDKVSFEFWFGAMCYGMGVTTAIRAFSPGTKAGMFSNGAAALLFAAKPIGAMLAGGARYFLVFVVIAFGVDACVPGAHVNW